jgi:zinc transport system substrate-binding protein
MNTSHTALSILGITATLACGACDRTQPDSAHTNKSNKNTTPVVFTVNFPLMSFAHETAGEWIDLESPELDGAHADDFDPTPEEIVSIQNADLILLNGAGFSPWAAMASLPSSRVVVTAEPFKESWLKDAHDHGHGHAHDDHQHGPEGEGAHAHESWASFTWLNPKYARIQAEVVGMAIARIVPEHSREIGERTKALAATLQATAERANRLKHSRMPTLIAAEPHYQYLEEACGLDLHDADWHWEEPAPHDGIESLEQLVEATAARYILVPSNPTGERAQLLTRLGLVPVIVDPLGNQPPGEKPASFVELMDRNLDALEAISSGQPSG